MWEHRGLHSYRGVWEYRGNLEDDVEVLLFIWFGLNLVIAFIWFVINPIV